MSSFYKTTIIVGAGLGLGWAVAEGYGLGGIIGLMLVGGFVGAMIALIKEKKWKKLNVIIAIKFWHSPTK